MFGKLFGFGGGRARAEKPRPSREELLSRLADHLAPTLMLEEIDAPGFSKLGGLPSLPADTAWPQSWGEPAPFLAQIDLADVRAAGGPDWLPESGRLFFFGGMGGDGRAA